MGAEIKPINCVAKVFRFLEYDNCSKSQIPNLPKLQTGCQNPKNDTKISNYYRNSTLRFVLGFRQEFWQFAIAEVFQYPTLIEGMRVLLIYYYIYILSD